MRFTSIATLFLMLPLLNGCAAVGTGVGDSSWVSVPTHEFASNRATNFSYRLSPDGSKLAWLAVSGARLVLHVRHLESGRLTTRDALGALSFDWSADGRQLVSNGLKVKGSENSLIVAFDADANGGALTALAGARDANTRLLGASFDAPGALIVEQNKRDQANPDLFSLNAATRNLTLLETNDRHTATWLLTSQGSIGGRIVRTGAGQALEIGQPDSAYRRVYAWEGQDQVSVVSISNDRATTWLLSGKDADRVRLIELDNTSGAPRVMHEDSEVDVAGVSVDPASGVPLLAVSEAGYPRTRVLDMRLSGLLDRLLAANLASRLTIESADRRFARFVVAVATDRGRNYYLLDLPGQRIDALGKSATEGFHGALAQVKPVKLSARDGTMLHGYLTLPKRAAGALPPLVLQVHGGPWEHTVWTYDAMSQLLANRGYAVLDINFRGSTGYGRAFQTKGEGEWGAGMQTDLYDAVAWAGAEGLVDPARVAVIGGSYGGYAAVTALLDQPRTFSCGIAINGPLDLRDMVATLPERFRHDRPRVLRYVGAVNGDDARLRERSPSTRAAELSRPLLLVQGTSDARVNPAQAAQFAAAAQSAGAPITYWPVADAGHVFTDWKTTLALYRRSEQFLAACLGGRDAGFDYYELGYKLF